MKFFNCCSIFIALLLAISSCTDYKETKAIIDGSTMNPLIGYDWAAKSWYKFEVNGKIYVDTIYFNSNEKILIEGEEIIIDYKPNRKK